MTSGEAKKTLGAYENDFRDAINEDLNTSQALATLHDMLNDHGSPKKKLELVKKFDDVLGLQFANAMHHSRIEDSEIVEKQRQYDQLRANKQFVQSDALRKEIEGLGYSVRDTETGSYIVKKFF